MNWLGAGLPTLLAALCGAGLGAALHALLLHYGVDFPPLIALAASLFAVLPSREASGLRGILVASLSCWAGALAEVLLRPERGVLSDVLHFSERLDVLRAALYAACAVLGVVAGSRARPGIGRRQMA